MAPTMTDELLDIDRRMRIVVERGWEEAPSPSLSRPPYQALDEPRAVAKRKPDMNNCDIPTLQAASKKIRLLEAEKADLNRRLAVANNKISTIHEEVEHIEKVRQECQNASHAPKRLVDDLQTQLSLKNEANNALEVDVTTLREQLKTAREQLQEADAHVKVWKEAKCWLVERYRIPHGSVWDSLQTIVETSLDGTITKMTIKDPYMDQPHQQRNFKDLCLYVAGKERRLVKITLVTSNDRWSARMTEWAGYVKEMLARKGIEFDCVCCNFHDREIRIHGGVYVDLSGDGDFNELVVRDLGATSGVGRSDAVSQRSGTLAFEEQQEPVSSPEGRADEGGSAEKSASEAADALGPVPEAWLVAAKSWHKACRCIDRRDRERNRAGFKCPCDTCRERGGRFSARGFRGYVQHFGGGPFGFRFACPFDGCRSARKTREQFIEHLRESHWVDTNGKGASWSRKRLGRYQSTVRGPTRLDPFFRRSTSVLVDEPLPPKEWAAYLASLRRPSASDEDTGASHMELEGSGDSEGEAHSEKDGRGDDDGLAGEATRRARASATSESGPSGSADAEANGDEEFAEATAAATAAGVALLAASAGGKASGAGRSKKKKASKRRRAEGDQASEERKTKRKGGDEASIWDTDFDPDSDGEA